MKLSSSAMESIEATIREDLIKSNTEGDGKPKTMSELEDIVTEMSQKFSQKILKEMIDNESLTASPEKKTARIAKSH